MSQDTRLVLDPGETIEHRIESVLAIMSEDVNDDDRLVLQRMLEQALEMKKKSECQTLADLRKKYASKKQDQEVINVVDDSPEVKKKKPPPAPKKAKTTENTPKKITRAKKVTPKKVAIAATVKGPPTKRKAPPSPAASEGEEEEGSGSEYDPVDSDYDSNDSDHAACTPKRGRAKVQAKGSARKRRARGSRPPLVWCSSESEAGGSKERKKTIVLFTEEELKAMYDTAMDDPDIIPGKNTKGMSNAEKNKRRRKLFLKMKRNVNAVGGNNRRKKSLFYKFTDHKNRTKDKHRHLVNKYGKSGSAKMPDTDALTPMEVRCLECWGVEASGWAVQTPMDVASSDGGTDNEAAKIRLAEKEEKKLEDEYKEKEKQQAGKPQETKKISILDALRERYKIAPTSKPTMVPRELSAEAAALIQQHKPARRVRARRSRSQVFRNSEDDADEEEQVEEESPRKYIDITPPSAKPSTSRQSGTRSSERLASKSVKGKTTATGNHPDMKRGLAADFHDEGEDRVESVVVGSLPDLSDDNTQRSDEQEISYSVHIRPHDMEEGKRSSHVTSFPDDDPPKSPKKSSTPKGRHPATGSGTSGQAPTVGHLPTVATVITLEDSEKNPSQDQSNDLQVAFLHSEMSCVRENLQKMQKLPNEMKCVQNSIDSVHGDITTVGANCVTLKTDVSSILEEVRDADKLVHDIKTHVLGLHAESNNLKGDIHGLKSKAVEVKVVCQATKDEVGSARVDISSVAGDVRIVKEDVTSVEGKISILQQDVAHMKHEMGLMKSDFSTVRHDLATLKSSVNNINRGIAIIESALVSRCDKVDKQVGTDANTLEEIKSDPGSVDGETPRMELFESAHSPEQREDNLSGLSSLNTSEVQFKPSAAFITYQKEQLRQRQNVVIGQCVIVDSEIDAIADTEADVRQKRRGQCVQDDSQTQPSQEYETQDPQCGQDDSQYDSQTQDDSQTQPSQEYENV